MTRSSRGYSLVELMVAVLIGLVLLAGVMQVFITSKQGYQVQASASRSQESSRFAMEYMTRYIALADLWSGVKSSSVSVVTSPTSFGNSSGAASCGGSWAINPQDGIHGYAGGTSVANPPSSCFSGTYVAQSDVLAIRYADPENYCSTANFSGGSSSSGSSGSAACGSAFPFWVRTQIGMRSEVVNSPTSSSITGDAADGVLNYPFQMAVFYISTVDNGEGPTPTLSVLLSGPSGVTVQPLADGVEMLKFQYGIDTNNDQSVDQYVDAGSVGNWSQVLSVRVSMVVRGDTLDNFTDTQSYQLTPSFCYGPASSSCTAKYNYQVGAEKFQRRMVVREIQLRNRTRG